MRFATATRVMTPERPVFMNGFGARNRKSEGVHDELYVKAALLEAGKRVLMITFDACGGDHSFAAALKGSLRREFGLNADEVLLNFSHTHASIYLTGMDPQLRRGGYSIAQDAWPEDHAQVDYTEDERIYLRIERTVTDMVRECVGKLCEGKLLIACGQADLAVSRRLMVNGRVEWRPNEDADYDRDLVVMKLVDSGGATRAILFSYGCHPTALGADNYLLSADFCGHAVACLETRYPDATALFLQGCGGELKPRISVEGGKFRACTFEQMEQAGSELAAAVAHIMESGAFSPADGVFRTGLVRKSLHTSPLPVADCEALAADGKSVFAASAARRLLALIRDGAAIEQVPVHIAVWQLDEDTRLIAIEGEVVSDYGKRIKALYPHGRTIVLGYSNAVFCYIPTAQMVGEGGYEAECNFFFGIAGPFLPEIEQTLLDGVAGAGRGHPLLDGAGR